MYACSLKLLTSVLQAMIDDYDTGNILSAYKLHPVGVAASVQLSISHI